MFFQPDLFGIGDDFCAAQESTPPGRRASWNFWYSFGFGSVGEVDNHVAANDEVKSAAEPV